MVELGGFGALSNFGAVTYCNSPDFEGVSGILGFGTPTPGSLGSQPQPLPLLFILTGGSIDHVPPVEPGSNLLPVRAFSFHAKENAAELHLGGYDPAAVTGKMAVFPTVMPTQCAHQHFPLCKCVTLCHPIQNCNTFAGTWRPPTAFASATRSCSGGPTPTLPLPTAVSFPRFWTQDRHASSYLIPSRYCPPSCAVYV